MSEHHGLPPALDELANEVGDFICYWGFKKVHGRLWTYLYLSSEPLDAAQLIGRLGVSKALISLSINDLLRMNVITESGKSSRGTQTYVANPDLIEVIFNVLRNRESKMLAKAEAQHHKVASLPREVLSDAKLSTDRVESLGKVIHFAQNTLQGFFDLTHVDLKDWKTLTDEKTEY